MHFRVPLAGAAAALLAVPAAAPAAPSAALTKTCYVSASPTAREPVGINAEGFFPGSVISVFVDDVQQPADPAGPPTADAAGELHGSVLAPWVASNQRWFTVRLTQDDNNPDTVDDPTAVARAKVTALSVTQSPTRPRTTSSLVRFRGRGFTDRTLPIYAHYVRHDKLSRTVLIGKPFGDCGQFSVRRPQFPFRNPRTGTWYVQFDQDQAYNPNATLYTRLRIVVSRKFV
jgi:hypothetical protein